MNKLRRVSQNRAAVQCDCYLLSRRQLKFAERACPHRRNIEAKIGKDTARLGAKKFATDLVVWTSRTFKNKYLATVPRKLKGEGRAGEPTSDGNNFHIAHDGYSARSFCH